MAKLLDDIKEVPHWVWLGGAAGIGLLYILHRGSSQRVVATDTSGQPINSAVPTMGQGVSNLQDYGVYTELANIQTLLQSELDKINNPVAPAPVTFGGSPPTATGGGVNPGPVGGGGGGLPGPIVPPPPGPVVTPQPGWYLNLWSGSGKQVYVVGNSQNNFWAWWNGSWTNIGGPVQSMTWAGQNIGPGYNASGLGNYSGTYNGNGVSLSGYPT